MLDRFQGEVRLDMECQGPRSYHTLPYGTLMLLRPVLQYRPTSLQREGNDFTIDEQYTKSFSKS